MTRQGEGQKHGHTVPWSVKPVPDSCVYNSHLAAPDKGLATQCHGQWSQCRTAACTTVTSLLQPAALTHAGTLQCAEVRRKGLARMYKNWGEATLYFCPTLTKYKTHWSIGGRKYRGQQTQHPPPPHPTPQKTNNNQAISWNKDNMKASDTYYTKDRKKEEICKKLNSKIQSKTNIGWCE